ILASAQDEAPALERNVSHRGLPDLTIVHGGSAPDIHVFRVHGRAKQRHVVLPANRRPKKSGFRWKYRHGGTVAHSPDQTLGTRWHELPVPPPKFAIGTEEQNRAI